MLHELRVGSDDFKRLRNPFYSYDPSPRLEQGETIFLQPTASKLDPTRSVFGLWSIRPKEGWIYIALSPGTGSDWKSTNHTSGVLSARVPPPASFYLLGTACNSCSRPDRGWVSGLKRSEVIGRRTKPSLLWDSHGFPKHSSQSSYFRHNHAALLPAADFVAFSSFSSAPGQRCELQR